MRAIDGEQRTRADEHVVVERRDPRIELRVEPLALHALDVRHRLSAFAPRWRAPVAHHLRIGIQREQRIDVARIERAQAHARACEFWNVGNPGVHVDGDPKGCAACGLARPIATIPAGR
jgi:hypothetical protein